MEEAKELHFVCNFAVCVNSCDSFLYKKKITRQEMYQNMYIQCSDSKSIDCQKVTEKNAFKRKRFDFECDRNVNSCVLVKFIGVQAGFAKPCKSGLSRYPAAANTNTTGIGAFRMARKSN